DQETTHRRTRAGRARRGGGLRRAASRQRRFQHRRPPGDDRHHEHDRGEEREALARGGRADRLHDRPAARRRARRGAAGDLARAGRHGPNRVPLGPARRDSHPRLRRVRRPQGRQAGAHALRGRHRGDLRDREPRHGDPGRRAAGQSV
ncbi:MAG: hypothetical protein AVDCRST_MAG45-193, partial [uncultured Solirubrobacterales bacterium]